METHHRPLTDRERRFVEEYTGGEFKFVGTHSAIAAGYSKNSAYAIAHELLGKPHIQEAIQALMTQMADKCAVTTERVIRELALLGFSNMRDYIRLTDEGDAYINLSDLTRDQAAAISEITVDEYVDGRGEDARAVKRVKIKLSDKKGSLELLGKHLGAWKDTNEVSVNVNMEPRIYLPDNGRD